MTSTFTAKSCFSLDQLGISLVFTFYWPIATINLWFMVENAFIIVEMYLQILIKGFLFCSIYILKSFIYS